MFDLTGKVALITGSTKGIGQAIAEELARHGARVVISSRKADACDAVAAAINAELADEPGEGSRDSGARRRARGAGTTGGGNAPPTGSDRRAGLQRRGESRITARRRTSRTARSTRS